MATIAELRLPPDEFVLRHTLDTLEDVAFEVERLVAHDAEEILPYVWVRNVNADDLEATLREDPTVELIERLADTGDALLYQLHWIDSVEALIQILIEEGGTILTAEGTQDGWTLRTLFADREALTRTYHWCREHELSLDIQRIYNLDTGTQGRFGLTERQATALITAYERGYYDVPRGDSLTAIAEELDISHQALSEQIRRGQKTLIKNSLLIGHNETDKRTREA